MFGGYSVGYRNFLNLSETCQILKHLTLNPRRTSSCFYRCFSHLKHSFVLMQKYWTFSITRNGYIKASSSWACVQWYRALKWHRGRGEWEETTAEAGRCSVSPAHTWPQWLLVSSLQCIIPLPPCECSLGYISALLSLLWTVGADTTTRRNEIPLQDQQNSSPAEKKNNIRGEKLKRLWVQLPPTNTAVGGVNRYWRSLFTWQYNCLADR